MELAATIAVESPLIILAGTKWLCECIECDEYFNMIRREEGILHERLTYAIIGAFFEVYNELGYGFLESVYAAALADVLHERGHTVSREVAVAVQFRGKAIAWQRLDMVIDDCVILEIKASSELPKIAPRQVYNYLKATSLEVGLLLHFGPDPRFYRLASPRRS